MGGTCFGESEFFRSLLGLPLALEGSCKGVVLLAETGLAFPAGDPLASGFEALASQYWLYALIRYFADSLGPSG